jgi:uncharacterized protein
MNAARKALASAFGFGLLFGVGLTIAGMTQPAKVAAFLDFFGAWDPSLAFVMGGALLAFGALYRVVVRRRGPVYAPKFALPTRRDLDASLLSGAALFGIGWALGGLCPGPALTSLGSFMPQAWLFTVAMVAGMGIKRGLDAYGNRRARPPVTTKPHPVEP